MPTFRTTDDVTLAYTDEGEGRPVVLVHGYTAPAASWALTVDALLEAGYRAIAFDRRAHGESETPGARPADGAATAATSASSWPTSTSDDAVVVGASMGGNTFWAYVDQFGPARLRAAVIVDQTPKMLNADGWDARLLRLRRRPTPAPSSPTGVPDNGNGRTVDRSGARCSASSSGSAARRRSATPRPRRRSPCSSTTPGRTGATSCGASPCPCSCSPVATARSGPASTPRPPSPGRRWAVPSSSRTPATPSASTSPTAFNEALLDFLAEVDADSAARLPATRRTR